MNTDDEHDDPTDGTRRVNRTRISRAPADAETRVAAERTVETREPVQRSGGDTAHFGIGAHPGPAERAVPSREPAVPEEPLTRVRREARQVNAFYLPLHRKKPNWDYEWKVVRVLAQAVDPAEFQEIRNAAWRPEKAADWPELVEPGTSPDAPIERLGQRLYGRPMHFTVQAREEDMQAAYQQQRDRTMAAASGKSAVRGEEGIPTGRAVRAVPLSVEIEGLAGS